MRGLRSGGRGRLGVLQRLRRPSDGQRDDGQSAPRVTPPAGKIGFWARTFRDLGIDSSDPSVAAYLYVIGGTCLLAAFIYFLATAGFPPHTTTTFEYGANGSVTESTSPGTLEFLVCFALFVVGGILVRAGKAASAESRK